MAPASSSISRHVAKEEPSLGLTSQADHLLQSHAATPPIWSVGDRHGSHSCQSRRLAFFTSLHFTSLHFTSLHFTSLHFTSLCLCGTGLRLVQLLPVNDTSVYRTFWDSYPYCTLSVSPCMPAGPGVMAV